MKSVLKLAFIVLLLPVTSKAQTFYSITASYFTSSTYENCDSISIGLAGVFNSPCCYFDSNANITPTIQGNNIFFYKSARDASCDLGFPCIAITAPFSDTFNFAPTNLANGTYSAFLVIENACLFLPVSFLDTIQLPNLVIQTTTIASPTITHNASVPTYVGDPVTYSVNPGSSLPYTCYWYRNGQLTFNSTTSNWSTNINSISDTVFALVDFTPSCLANSNNYSDTLVINAQPNSLDEIKGNKKIELVKNQRGFVVNGLEFQSEATVISTIGNVVQHSNLSSLNSEIIMTNLPKGVYLIRLTVGKDINIYKMIW